MVELLTALFFAFWFFAPAGLANVCAFASGKIAFLRPYNYPVDFNLRIKGKRILGSHKTIRGFVVGIAAAIIGVYLQVFFYDHLSWQRAILPINYDLVNPILLGFLLGFGALVGDAVKSYFKRLRGIQPGISWFPFDQIDFIIGGIVLTFFYIQLSWLQYLTLFIVWVVLHPLISFIGYLLKLKRKPI
jgi:CDP-2,3-bis-(O-geranylgeranyl)-sn-glycerol synthase